MLFLSGRRILDSSMKRNSKSLSQTKKVRKTPIKMDGEEKTVWNKQGKETKTFKKRPATQSKSWWRPRGGKQDIYDTKMGKKKGSKVKTGKKKRLQKRTKGCQNDNKKTNMMPKRCKNNPIVTKKTSQNGPKLPQTIFLHHPPPHWTSNATPKDSKKTVPAPKMTQSRAKISQNGPTKATYRPHIGANIDPDLFWTPRLESRHSQLKKKRLFEGSVLNILYFPRTLSRPTELGPLPVGTRGSPEHPPPCTPSTRIVPPGRRPCGGATGESYLTSETNKVPIDLP